ncbi:MAG: mechanosensitive ion channel, partial [Serpentinimonas sp.]|nr:mechanosensitive ion channel [Serpentinimonas sp.]
NRVENLSLADPQVWQSTVVNVDYSSDVAVVARILEDAALQHERVLRDPPPRAMLTAFAADRLEFTLGYWIADPENGPLGLRSSINMAILAAFRAQGINIPFPQRVLHLKPAQAAEGLAAELSPPPPK